MIKLAEILITLGILVIGDKIVEKHQPNKMELHLSNGKISYIEISKNNYSCPQYCLADHYHNTVILENESDQINYTISYIKNNEGDILKLNDIDVVDIFEIKEEKLKKKNNKKNQHSNIEKEKIEISNFIEVYN